MSDNEHFEDELRRALDPGPVNAEAMLRVSRTRSSGFPRPGMRAITFSAVAFVLTGILIGGTVVARRALTLDPRNAGAIAVAPSPTPTPDPPSPRPTVSVPTPLPTISLWPPSPPGVSRTPVPASPTPAPKCADEVFRMSAPANLDAIVNQPASWSVVMTKCGWQVQGIENINYGDGSARAATMVNPCPLKGEPNGTLTEKESWTWKQVGSYTVTMSAVATNCSSNDSVRVTMGVTVHPAMSPAPTTPTP
ncbi:MAG: hypothetical protein ACYDAY_03295 [Candidatus Dormibacteria bacterium]